MSPNEFALTFDNECFRSLGLHLHAIYEEVGALPGDFSNTLQWAHSLEWDQEACELLEAMLVEAGCGNDFDVYERYNQLVGEAD